MEQNYNLIHEGGSRGPKIQGLKSYKNMKSWGPEYNLI